MSETIMNENVTAPVILTTDLFTAGAARFASALDARDKIFIQCQEAYDALTREDVAGANRGDVATKFAEAVTIQSALLQHPDDADARAVAMGIASNRPGGAKITKNAVTQRADAWGIVLAHFTDLWPVNEETGEIDLTPTAVARAYRYTAGGANKDDVKALSEKGSPASDEKSFIDACNAAIKALDLRKAGVQDAAAKKRADKKATEEAENEGENSEKSDAPTFGNTVKSVLDALTWAVANIGDMDAETRIAVFQNADRLAKAIKSYK